MCNYSGYAAKTRDAVKGDTMVVHHGGFFEPNNLEMAVCLKPGTELGFSEPIRHCGSYRYSNHQWNPEGGWALTPSTLKEQVARSRIVGPENLDAIEFSDGTYMLLTNLIAGQRVKVLQLPVGAVEVKTDQPAQELV